MKPRIRRLRGNASTRRTRLLVLLWPLLAITMTVLPTFASVNGGYGPLWNTIDGGGVTYGTVSGTGGGTIGQPDARTWSGGGYTLYGGFWVPGDSSTPTSTATSTRTATATATRTSTASATNTNTATRTRTATATASVSATSTFTQPFTFTATATRTATIIPTFTATLTPTNVITATATWTPPVLFTPTIPAGCANHYFVPEVLNGTPGPENGGTVNVGDRFVLDMMVHVTGPYTSTAQQAYLSYTPGLLQNASVASIGGSCVLTNTVTTDTTVFAFPLQNEVCNGPNPCAFTSGTVPAGSMAFASGSLTINQTSSDFRVARVGLCAYAPGTATLRWQFSPPDPANRDTEILDSDGTVISNRACYVDYTINIAGTAYTPTSTPTGLAGTGTPTITITRTPTVIIIGTPMPGAVLVGHVTWPGSSQPNSRQMQPLTLTLSAGGTPISFPPQLTDSYGFFTVTVDMMAPGTYSWHVKGMRSLASCGVVTLWGASQTNMESGAMSAGDASGNNVVDAQDFQIVRSQFGMAGPNLIGDLDNNLIVNVADVNILKLAYGRAGCASLVPGVGMIPRN